MRLSLSWVLYYHTAHKQQASQPASTHTHTHRVVAVQVCVFESSSEYECDVFRFVCFSITVLGANVFTWIDKSNSTAVVYT